MRSVLWWGGVIVGALALTALIADGFGMTLAAPFDAVLDTYDLVVRAVFGKIEPTVGKWLVLIQDRAGRELHLYPHWRNLFLLIWLYFLADIRSAVEQRRPVLAIVLFVWGTLVALVTSAGAGTVPLDGAANTNANFMFLAFPVLGLTLHQTGWCLLEAILSRGPGESAAGRFTMFVREEVLPIALGGAAALALCVYAQNIPLLALSPQPALALFVALIATLAFFHLWRGGVYAALDRDPTEPWWHAFSRTGSARLAFFMLSTMIGAALIFAADTALKVGG